MDFEINLNVYKMKYKEPRFSSQQCILKNKSYTMSLYVPIYIKHKGLEIFN